jgi:hypothetical protein
VEAGLITDCAIVQTFRGCLNMSRNASPLLPALAAVAMALYGPIAQLPHYHEFADTRTWHGVPHAADVLSNLPFALVAAWAAARAMRPGARSALGSAWPGFVTFVLALALTAAGSGYYHWAPDNARLVWDRVPIALACAGLLDAMHARHHPGTMPWRLPGLVAFALASVAWWAWTDARGMGDLRPYLLLQGAPLVLVPLWQASDGAARRERLGFAVAIALYVVAKILEIADARVFEATGVVSGHTLKHVAAALAAAVIVQVLTRPGLRSPRASPAPRPGWSESRRSP